MPPPDIDLPYPDEYLRRKVVSLPELCEKYEELLLGDDYGVPQFVRLALSGRLERVPGAPDRDYKYLVNVSRDAFIPDNEDDYVTSGDFDSAFGQTKDLPFVMPLAVFPIPSFQDTLTKNNHCKGDAYDSQDHRIKVPLHTIPNVAIGKVARRHITRIAFPRMYSKLPDKKIPPSALKFLFDSGIRRVVEDIMPERLTHWPADYDTAFRAAQDTQGRLHHSSVDISPAHLDEFGRRLLEYLAEEPDMQDAYFIHELRGYKGGTSHDPNDMDARDEAMDQLMSCLDPDRCDPEEWGVDIALEIHIPGHVTHIAQAAHFRLVKWLLPSLSDDQVQKVLDSDRFLTDHCASLENLAGFRCEVGHKGRGDQISYLNVYCTEKSVIYQLHDNGVFRRRKTTELYPNSIGALIKDVDYIGKAFSTARGDGDTSGVPGNARFEIRVPLQTALDRFRSFPAEIAELGLIAIPLQTWWQFKFFRLSALLYVLQHLKDAPPEARAWPSCLALGAFTTHQLDALLHRPAAKPQFQRLLECCSPHEREDDDDADSALIPIGYGHGLLYISDLVLSDKVWRLPTTRMPDTEDLIFFYRAPDMPSIQAQFDTHHAMVPKSTSRNPHRTHNRRTVTMDVRHLRPDDAADHQETINLPPDNAIRLRDRIQPQGPDVDNMAQALPVNSDDENEDGASDDVNKIITSIWAQLPYDMISMAPNKKSNKESSHILLGTADASQTTMDIFRSFDMSRIFPKIQARLCDEATWEQIFSRYFPPKSFLPPERGGLQGFPYMKFWQTWRTMTARLSSADCETVRKTLRIKWNTLKWIPHATNDRAWETKQAKGRAFVRLPPNSTGPCPQIAINPRSISLYRQIKLAGRQANEEAGDDSDDAHNS